MLRLKHFRKLCCNLNRPPGVFATRSLFWQKGPEEKDTAAGAAYNVDDLVQQTHKPVENDRTNYTSAFCRFFMKDVETQLLSYPEVAEEKNLEEIEKTKEIVSDLLTTEKVFTKSLLEQWKSMDLLKYNVPTEYGGKNYSLTETVLAAEVEMNNLESSMILNSHRSVCSLISQFGNDDQRQRFLPKLTSGKTNDFQLDRQYF